MTGVHEPPKALHVQCIYLFPETLLGFSALKGLNSDYFRQVYTRTYTCVILCMTFPDILPPNAEAELDLRRGPLQDLWQHRHHLLTA